MEHCKDPGTTYVCPIIDYGLFQASVTGETDCAWSTIMPIRPFLAGQPFEPELIRQMSLALESVCERLELNLTDDPATRGSSRRRSLNWRSVVCNSGDTAGARDQVVGYGAWAFG
jgi:hypothetical protein